MAVHVGQTNAERFIKSGHIVNPDELNDRIDKRYVEKPPKFLMPEHLFPEAIAAGLAPKADKTYVDTELAEKADADAVALALADKADKTVVSNVNNTSDADKPVSTAQADALALKVDKSDNVDSGWQNLTGFATGWTSNSTYPARYRTIKAGPVTTVRLDGVLTRGAGTTSSLITLPAALRPGYAKIVGQNSTTSATPKLGTLEITAPGVLRMIYTEAIADNVTINCSYVL